MSMKYISCKILSCPSIFLSKVVSHPEVYPPSATSVAPVMKLLIGDARNVMQSATSSIFIILSSGVRCTSFITGSVPGPFAFSPSAM
jgi:hypothetical protein